MLPLMSAGTNKKYVNLWHPAIHERESRIHELESHYL